MFIVENFVVIAQAPSEKGSGEGWIFLKSVAETPLSVCDVGYRYVMPILTSFTHSPFCPCTVSVYRYVI